MANHKTRPERCEGMFEPARSLARQHGMLLLNPSDGCYQLRHLTRGWIVNLYPRRKGFTPRIYHDPHHRGPFFKVPELWTLLDVVRAAIDEEKEAPQDPEVPA